MTADNEKTHTKTVKGKLVLVPSLQLVKTVVEDSPGPFNAKALRARLKQMHEVQLICPVTLRRHFKTLRLKPAN
jgi:hypothetical protein